MISTQRATGTFSSYEVAEAALVDLKDRNFSMAHVSVVGRDVHRHNEVTGANVTDRVETIGNGTVGNGTVHRDDRDDPDAKDAAKTGAAAGSAVGGLTGLLVGLGAIAIPGVGPVMLAGAAATAIATTISGTVIGAAAGSLAGGLIGLGLPAEQADAYSDRVSDGHYLIMIEGSPAEIDLAHEVLRDHRIQDWYTYEVPSDSMRSMETTTTQRRM